MASPPYFQTIYKSVDDQSIDVDVYLPSNDQVSGAPKCPVCKSTSQLCQYMCSTLTISVIDIHGGAFMLGSSKMVNKDQIQDCLSRGWVVLAPNHRLCPQVNLLEGPMRDCRDLLEWIHDGELETAIRDVGGSSLVPDLNYVFAFGTSSGGTLALSLVSPNGNWTA